MTARYKIKFHLKFILVLVGFSSQFSGYSQTDTLFKNGLVNMATLVVNFSTNAFEGGTMSYYSCSSCPIDSIPFIIDFKPPSDFGGITFKLSPLQDTVFDASIIWLGTGEVNYPKEFNSRAPFIKTNHVTNKPNDIRYIDYDGGRITDSYFLSKTDSIWSHIETLKIVRHFANTPFKVVVYLYPPAVGAMDPNKAKWIVFLYSNDESIAVNRTIKNSQLRIFPNPAQGKLKIDLNSTDVEQTRYRVFNQTGQLVFTGDFAGNYHELDMSKLTSGLYFLQLRDDNNSIMVTEKIIIE